MMITGTRWFFNDSLVPTRDDRDQNTDPYYFNNTTTTTTLFIDMPFTGSSHIGTYTCSPNNMFAATPPGDTVTLNAGGEYYLMCILSII